MWIKNRLYKSGLILRSLVDKADWKGLEEYGRLSNKRKKSNNVLVSHIPSAVQHQRHLPATRQEFLGKSLDISLTIGIKCVQ